MAIIAPRHRGFPQGISAEVCPKRWEWCDCAFLRGTSLRVRWSKDVEGFRGMMWGWVKKSLSFGTATATGSGCSGYQDLDILDPYCHSSCEFLLLFLLRSADWCTGYFQSKVIFWAICGATDSVSILSRCVRTNMKEVKNAKDIPPKEASKHQKSSFRWLTWHSNIAAVPFPLISDMSSGGCRKVFSPQKSESCQSCPACIQQWEL